MAISVFDMFKVGIGPSSSHTVGPMRAALLFTRELAEWQTAGPIGKIRVELFGSLGATAHGHGTVKAVILGLLGHAPHTVDPRKTGPAVQAVYDTHTLPLPWGAAIAFEPDEDILLHGRRRLDFHTNGMQFHAYDNTGGPVINRTYYSVGGGFILDDGETGQQTVVPDTTPVPYPFTTAAQLVGHARATGRSISWIMLQNELVNRTEQEVRDGLLDIWSVMQECVRNGYRGTGVLPGGLKVRRRAAALHEQLLAAADTYDPLHAMEWITLFALAVNEENAAGGRVVTAPTNGAAGIVPAVLHYYTRFVPGSSDDGVIRFLLTAAAIGILFKEGASISGAEVGCQGEVGSACAMAAAGLAEVLGGNPEHVENAAEIGIEHNLGLTCDPVGGLVQIPCIERNAVASVKAITAARMAIHGDGQHHVSLDKAIMTMRDTGADMSVKYKETARGGLALHIIPVNIVEC